MKRSSTPADAPRVNIGSNTAHLHSLTAPGRSGPAQSPAASIQPRHRVGQAIGDLPDRGGWVGDVPDVLEEAGGVATLGDKTRGVQDGADAADGGVIGDGLWSQGC